MILLASFFHLVEPLPIAGIGKDNIFSMFCSLETDIREQKNYEKRIQISVDNAVNDLRYESKFENIRNVWNIAFLKFFKKYIFFLETYFLSFLRI